MLTNSRYSWIFDNILLFIVIGLFFAIWLGSHPLLVPDEARYSEVAREMLVRGDYITPHLNGTVLLDKPVFYYWLQVIAIKLFGLNEWALRLWPAFFGVLGCLFTYSAGRLLFNRRTGLLAASILATSPLYFGLAHYANLDIEVTVLITASLFSFLIGLQKQSTLFLIVAYICSGLAILTKGLIGIAFPALIVGLWIISLRRWDLLKQLNLGMGILIVAIINLPWLLLAEKANPGFLQHYFITEQFTRFLSKSFNNQQPLWFYVPVIFLGFFPWSLFLFSSICHSRRHNNDKDSGLSSGNLELNIFKTRTGFPRACSVFFKNTVLAGMTDKEVFLYIWIIAIFVFFSLPASKTVGYILPIFPPLALLVGNYLDKNWDKKPHWLITIVFILITIIASYYAFTWPNADDLKPYLIVVGIILLLAALLTVLFSKKLFFTWTVTMVLVLLCFIIAVPHASVTTTKYLATSLVIKDTDEVVSYYQYYYDLPLYLQRQVSVVEDWNSPDIPLNDTWRRELWLGSKSKNATIVLLDEKSFLQHWHAPHRVFVFTSKNYFARLQRLIANRYVFMGQYDDILLISNQ